MVLRSENGLDVWVQRELGSDGVKLRGRLQASMSASSTIEMLDRRHPLAAAVFVVPEWRQVERER